MPIIIVDEAPPGKLGMRPRGGTRLSASKAVCMTFWRLSPQQNLRRTTSTPTSRILAARPTPSLARSSASRSHRVSTVSLRPGRLVSRGSQDQSRVGGRHQRAHPPPDAVEMADSASLDSLVKGAPMPGKDVKPIGTTTPIAATAAGKEGDPLSHTPSSPSMIYLNLLVLEASLRAQYLELRARRRHHTFFLILLTAWNAAFGYALFLAPREDGRGVGGSVYWGVEVVEKLCLIGGVVTTILVWGTGIWDRGIKWPRRWFGISNRGLRGFNCKLVIIRRPWWAELGSTVGFFLTYGLFSHTASSSYRYVDPAMLRDVEKDSSLRSDGHPTLPVLGEDEERGGHDEDLSPGGDYVKLLLLAKPFSPTFRENWELYRTEYWEKENERRALIRAKLKARDREYAKHRWGWSWWLPWRRAEIDRHFGREGSPQPRHPAIGREHKRSNSVRRSSTSSSRSQTPTVELEEAAGVTRKASTASNASDKLRKKLSSGSRTQKRPESRSVTPDIPSPLAKESSFGTTSSKEGGRTLRNSSSRNSIGPARGKSR
jgi:hypothetical protein